MTVDIPGSHRQADASSRKVMPCILITNVSSHFFRIIQEEYGLSRITLKM